MLASNPAWMLNHITPDLGIPDSVKSRHALSRVSVQAVYEFKHCARCSGSVKRSSLSSVVAAEVRASSERSGGRLLILAVHLIRQFSRDVP